MPEKYSYLKEAASYSSAQWMELVRRLEHRIKELEQGSAASSAGKSSDAPSTESRLAECEYEFRILVETAHDGICLLQDDRFLYANPQLALMLKSNLDDLRQKPFPEFIQPSDRPRILDLYTRHQGGEHFNRPTELNLRTNRGEALSIEVSGSVIRRADRPATLLIVRDITERKRRQIEHERIERQLRQMQKLESLGTLAGGIAHDFNTILSVIQGFAEVTDELPDASVLVRENQRQILIAVERAKKQVEKILTFSRKMDRVRQPIRISRIIRETVGMLQSYLPAVIGVETAIDDDTGSVLAESADVQQILLNLSVNAYDAMPGGGKLFIGLEPVVIQSVTEDSPPPGRYARLTVRDTGPGMDANIISHLFEPFFTTKPVGEGTGLGLSVVHGIVRDCGGRITVESRIGEGSSFIVLLPLVQGAIPTDESMTDKQIEGGHESILLAEDDRQMVAIYRLILETLGYRVTVAMNGRTAWRTFADQPEAFDLIITDQIMEDMDGHDLLRRISRVRGDLPVILISGLERSEVEDKIVKKDRVRFLMKPFGKAALARLVRELLDDRGSDNGYHPHRR